MIVELDLKSNVCTVTREDGDPKFYGAYNSAGESRLLHHVKKLLNKHGHDLIKKRMWKDGHLVDDMQQYLRTRSKNSPAPHVYIYNPSWAIRGAEDDFNEGKVDLAIVQDIFNV